MRMRRLAAPLALATLSLAVWVNLLYVDPPEQYGIES